MVRRWGGGSGARANKSVSTPIPYQRCPSWQRLVVGRIVCLPILQIGGFTVHAWCWRGSGGDSTR